MYGLKALVFSTILASATASPLSVPVFGSNNIAFGEEKTSFQVPRAPVSKEAGSIKLTRAYAKHGFAIPHHLKAAAEQAKLDSLAAQGSGTSNETAKGVEGGNEYIENVKIGSQTFRLDFDTGSSDLWVTSTLLPASEQQGHTLLAPNSSSTFQKIPGATWSIRYGDGSKANGIVGTDKVTVGSATVEKQAVEAAQQASGEITGKEKDGLLGLAFPKGNTVRVHGESKPQQGFYWNIMDQLKEPVFAVNFIDDKSGYYEFGAIDEQYSNKLVNVPVQPPVQGYWQFSSPSFTVDGQQYSSNRTNAVGIADTGTSQMLVYPDVAAKYWGQVQGARASGGLWTFPCNTKLPEFGVSLGSGHTAKISGETLRRNAQQQGSTCEGPIQSNMGEPFQIFGDYFFRDNYVVFDAPNKQLRVAQK